MGDNKLTMRVFLTAVDAHRYDTPEVLIAAGYHPKVVYAKAQKAAHKGYTEYGVVAHRPWLTHKGRMFLDGR